MNRNEKVSMTNDSYPVLIKEISGRFYLVCETLNIVTEGADLLSAYTEMRVLQEKTLERFKSMNLVPSPPLNYNLNRPSSEKKHLPSVKILVITAACLLFLMGGIVIPVVSAVNEVAKSFKEVRNKYEMLTDPSVLSKLLVNVANTLKNITPQRKEEIHENLRTIVNEIKPFMDEVRPLLSDNQSSGLTAIKKEGTLSAPTLENGNPENVK